MTKILDPFKLSMGTDVKEVVEEEIVVSYPKMYKVVLFNDNTTPFEFVIELLIHIFDKNINEAMNLTKQIHHEGRGIAGIYPRAIAEDKKNEVIDTARSNNLELKCEIEVQDDV